MATSNVQKVLNYKKTKEQQERISDYQQLKTALIFFNTIFESI